MKLKKMSIKTIVNTIGCLGLTLFISAQEGENLVPNGSFEENSGKTRRLGKINDAEGWTSPTGVSADLFSARAKGLEVQTPENVYGKEDPKDGDSYAGIIVYSYNDKERRSYLTTKLNSPLKKGMRYKVKFYASLAELSKYSSNRLGVHFSKRDITTNDKVPALIEETHVEHPKEVIFNGMYGWDYVCGEYVANGGERYITIGNFTPNSEVDNERNKKPRGLRGTQIVAAYYYIDDISVHLLGQDEPCDCGYADQAQTKTATIFQRRPSITERMSVSDKINEYGIYYRSERYDITIIGDQDLDAIAKLMKENPDIKVQINGHSDNFEYDNPDTRDISLKRAEYIRSQLVNKGVDASRLPLKDMQNTKPSQYLAENDDQKTKDAKNRRVSFELVE